MPIIAVLGGDLKLRDFDLRFNSHFKSSPIIVDRGKNISLKNGSFSEITRKDGNGGLLCYKYGSSDLVEDVYILIEKCSFKNIGVIGESIKGGGIYAHLAGSSQIVVNDSSSFCGCCAETNGEGTKGFGGGIYLLFEDDSSEFELNSITFEQCSANEGANVFVNASNLFRKINFTTLSFEIDLTDEISYSGIERDTTEEQLIIPLVLYLRNLSLPIYVNGTSGADFSACGFANYPCCSLNISSESRFGSESHNLFISQPFAFDVEYMFDGDEWNVSSLSCSVSNGFAVQSPNEHVFDALIITKMNSNFNNIMFNLTKSLNGRTSVFMIDSETLNLSNCGIQSYENEIDYGFALICGGDIISCGGAIYLNTVCGASFIGCCSFLGCTTSTEPNSGCGGGIFICSPSNRVSFVVSEPDFQREKPNAAKYGNDLFVSSDRLSRCITNTSLPFAQYLDIDNTTIHSMCGSIETQSNIIIPLIFYFLERGTTAYLSAAGIDIEVCGFIQYPCLSFCYVASNIHEHNTTEIIICTESSITSEILLDGVCVNSLDSLQSKLNCLSAQSGSSGKIISLTNDVSFSNLDFVLSESFTNNANTLFYCNASNLLLCNCGFKKQENNPDTYIHYALITIAKGSVNMKDVICKGIFPSHSMIEAPFLQGRNEINISAKNLNLPKVPLICFTQSEGTDANAESCIALLYDWSLTNVTLQDTNSSALISTQVYSSLSLNNCSLINVSSPQSRRGGSVCILTEQNGQFSIYNSSFKSCTAEIESVGYGGAIYSYLNSTKDIILKSVEFNDCSAWKGKNIFVISTNLNKSVSKSSFNFDYEAFADDENAFVGNDTNDGRMVNFNLLRLLIEYSSNSTFISDEGLDVSRCGSASEPCETIHFAKLHLRSDSFTICICTNFTLRSKEELSGYELRSDDSSISNVNISSSFSDVVDCAIFNNQTLGLSDLRFCISWQLPSSLISIIKSDSNSQSTKLRSVTFSEEDRNAILYCSLMIVLSGPVTLDNCYLSDLNFSVAPFKLFERDSLALRSTAKSKANDQSAQISFENCSFINIESRISNGTLGKYAIKENERTFISNCNFSNNNLINEYTNGGAQYFVVSSNGFCEIRESSFTECSVSESSGRGGAIFMKVIAKEANRFQFTTLLFSGNAAMFGENIFVECDDLEVVAPVTQFDFYLPVTDIDDCRFYYGTKYQNGADPINLYTYWAYHGEFVYLSLRDGEDTFLCGSKSSPCRSKDIIESRFEKNVSSTILFVDSSYSLISKIIFEGELENRGLHGFCRVGSSDPYPVPVTIGYSAPTGEERLDSLFTSTGNITIGGFLFDLRKLGYMRVIHSTAGILKVRECDFTFSSESTNVGILEKVKGELTISSVRLYNSENGAYSEASLFNISTSLSILSIDNVSIYNMSLISGELIKIITNSSSNSQTNEDSLYSITNCLASFITLDDSSSLIKSENPISNCMNFSFCNITNISSITSSSLEKSFSVSASGSFLLENCFFSNCTSSEMGGGIYLQTKGQFNFKRCSFVDCSAQSEDGRGGGIFVDLSNCYPDFLIFEPSFDSNKAKWGKDLFINSSNISKCITVSSFPFINEENLSSNSLRGNYIEEGREETIPLFVFLFNITDVFVSSLVEEGYGNDNKRCGYKLYPCITIDYALKFRSDSSVIQVLNTSTISDNALLEELPIRIAGTEHDAACIEIEAHNETADGSLMKVNIDTEIKNCQLILPNSITGHDTVFESFSLFLLADGSVTSVTQTISYTFVKVESGQMKFKDFVFHDIRIKNACGIIIADTPHNENSNNELYLNSCSFSNICLFSEDDSANGFIFASDETSVYIDKCIGDSLNLSVPFINGIGSNVSVYESTFTHIGCKDCSVISSSKTRNLRVELTTIQESIRQIGAGAAIEIKSWGTGTNTAGIINCTLNSCGVTANETGGGGLFSAIDADQMVRIENCSFANCSAVLRGSTGNGGGILLILKSNDAGFYINKPFFPDKDAPNANSADHGRNLYIIAPSLSEVINNETIPSIDDPTIDNSSMEGAEPPDNEPSVSLPLYVRELDEFVFVSSSGLDVNVCGFNDFSCLTLLYSFSRKEDDKKICVLDSIAFEEEIKASDCIYLIKGGTKLSGWNISSNASGDAYALITADTDLTISNLTIRLPDAFQTHLAFIESTNYLRINDCELECLDSTSSMINYYIFSLNRGRCSMSCVTCKNTEFINTSIIAYGENLLDLYLNELVFDNVIFSSASILSNSSTTELFWANASITKMQLANATQNGSKSLLCLSSFALFIEDSNLCCNNKVHGNGTVLNISESIIRMSNCSISGLNGFASSENNEADFEEDFSCKFEGSLITLRNCLSTISSVTFANSSIGALSIIEGETHFENCAFINNTINNADYNSVHRNILCEKGALIIDSYSDESGLRDPDNLLEGEYLELWMQNSGCTINGSVGQRLQESEDLSEETLKAFPQKVYQFCRPHVNSINRAEDEDQVFIRFVGSNLLPCLASFELFSLDTTDAMAEKQTVPLSFAECIFVNQNVFMIKASISQLQLAFEMEKTQIWARAVLNLKEHSTSELHSNGVSVVRTEYILLQDIIVITDPTPDPIPDVTDDGNEGNNRYSKSSTKSFPWWIILIVIGALVIVTVIVAVVIAKSRQSKKTSAIESDEFEDEAEVKGSIHTFEMDELGIVMNPVSETSSKGGDSSVVIQRVDVSKFEEAELKRKELGISSPGSINLSDGPGEINGCLFDDDSNKCSSSEASHDVDMFGTTEPLYPLKKKSKRHANRNNSADLNSNSSTAALLANESDSAAQSMNCTLSSTNLATSQFDIGETDSLCDSLEEDIMRKLLETTLLENSLQQDGVMTNSPDSLTDAHTISPLSAMQDDDIMIPGFDDDIGTSNMKGRKKGKKGKRRKGKKSKRLQEANEDEQEIGEDREPEEGAKISSDSLAPPADEKVAKDKLPEYYHASSSASSTPFTLFGDEEKAIESSTQRESDGMAPFANDAVDSEIIREDSIGANSTIAISEQTKSEEIIDSEQTEQSKTNAAVNDNELENPAVVSGETEQEQPQKKKKKKKKKKHQKSTEEEVNADPSAGVPIQLDELIGDLLPPDASQLSASTATDDKALNDITLSTNSTKAEELAVADTQNFADVSLTQNEQNEEEAQHLIEEKDTNEEIITEKPKKKKKKKKKHNKKEEAVPEELTFAGTDTDFQVAIEEGLGQAEQ
eukprot:MONOS_10828.1-p1 / transcript=MONOS_10828.1 / gene=MONOS_10828 / organism=Monocercomonoides_exilis_PA203 / gene_product=unspecified product / transcript_product=unspecified product / location=Mono_scaffold00508:35429-45609(-) / protein_length=3215 / sequence_SO=supercontig / SO=protein_coding / is_pseudo=false